MEANLSAHRTVLCEAVRSLFFVEVKTPRESFFSNDVKMYSAGCGAGGEYNLPIVCVFFRHVIIGYMISNCSNFHTFILEEIESIYFQRLIICFYFI